MLFKGVKKVARATRGGSMAALLLLLLFRGALGQTDLAVVLSTIEENNLSIQSMKSHLVLERAEASADNYIENPTIEAGRFPAVAGTGMKTVYGATQGFDFPTVYAKRKQLANQRNAGAEWAYQQARRQVLSEAKQLLMERSILQKMREEYAQRLELAKAIEQIAQQKMMAGIVGALEVNSAHLRTIEMAQQVGQLEARYKIVNAELTALNGMKPLDIETVVFESVLPAKDSLLAAFQKQDARFGVAQSQVAIAQAGLAVVRHQALPRFEVGFEDEKSNDEHFRGFRAGITIPLWGDVGHKKVARARLAAAQSSYAEAHNQLLAEFERKYLETESLDQRYQASKAALEGYENKELLKKAVALGEISVVEFYTEIMALYGLIDGLYELELAYCCSLTELTSFEL